MLILKINNTGPGCIIPSITSPNCSYEERLWSRSANVRCISILISLKYDIKCSSSVAGGYLDVLGPKLPVVCGGHNLITDPNALLKVIKSLNANQRIADDVVTLILPVHVFIFLVLPTDCLLFATKPKKRKSFWH